MTHHALINVKLPRLPPHTLAFPRPVPGSVLCQLEVLSVSQVWLSGVSCESTCQPAGSVLQAGGMRQLLPHSTLGIPVIRAECRPL